MSEKREFEIYLPDSVPPSEAVKSSVQKFQLRLNPGKNQYDVKHNLGTEDVIVQTRIAGRVREGGISVLNADTVRIEFGGPLHEEMDVVIIG